MRITLDTNVLVSAFISKRGHSARVLDVVLTLEDMELVLCDEIAREFSRVMSSDELLLRFDYTLADGTCAGAAIRKVDARQLTSQPCEEDRGLSCRAFCKA